MLQKKLVIWSDAANIMTSGAGASSLRSERREALMRPERAKAKAPEKFCVAFETTEGDFVVEVTRAWAPLGADRFYNMVKLGFFDDGIAFSQLDRRSPPSPLSNQGALSQPDLP